jgi:hypothetical protein
MKIGGKIKDRLDVILYEDADTEEVFLVVCREDNVINLAGGNNAKQIHRSLVTCPMLSDNIKFDAIQIDTNDTSNESGNDGSSTIGLDPVTGEWGYNS